MLVGQVLAGRGADALREYRILSRCAHGALVRSLALFGDVPRVGAHSLVLELVSGGPLLEWAAAAPQLYTQHAVAAHTKQLLSALHWLHTNNVAHLDIRVGPLLCLRPFYTYNVQLLLIFSHRRKLCLINTH